jgi:hypothetical protein
MQKLQCYIKSYYFDVISLNAEAEKPWRLIFSNNSHS